MERLYQKTVFHLTLRKPKYCKTWTGPRLRLTSRGRENLYFWTFRFFLALMCLPNQNALDPKHLMEASIELVDAIVKKMESLCISNGNSLSGQYCGRSLYHLIQVRYNIKFTILT